MTSQSRLHSWIDLNGLDRYSAHQVKRCMMYDAQSSYCQPIVTDVLPCNMT